MQIASLSRHRVPAFRSARRQKRGIPPGLARSTISNAGKLADAGVVKLMNPIRYIGAKGTTVARHWRIRHGTVDRDTSLAIPTILAAWLANSGAEVDFLLPWAQGHGGDYDLEELFGWMDRVCRDRQGVTLAFSRALPSSERKTFPVQGTSRRRVGAATGSGQRPV